MDEPNCKKSITDKDAPTRLKDRSENEDARYALSNKAIAEPSRAKVLRDKDAPMWQLSRTDSENTEPKRTKPRTDSCDPTRTNDLRENDEPTIT